MKVPTPAWTLVPVPADGLGDDTAGFVEEDTGRVDEPDAETDPEGVVLAGIEVNETGLGVGVPVALGVTPAHCCCWAARAA